MQGNICGTLGLRENTPRRTNLRGVQTSFAKAWFNPLDSKEVWSAGGGEQLMAWACSGHLVLVWTGLQNVGQCGACRGSSSSVYPSNPWSQSGAVGTYRSSCRVRDPLSHRWLQVSHTGPFFGFHVEKAGEKIIIRPKLESSRETGFWTCAGVASTNVLTLVPLSLYWKLREASFSCSDPSGSNTENACFKGEMLEEFHCLS